MVASISGGTSIDCGGSESTATLMFDRVEARRSSLLSSKCALLTLFRYSPLSLVRGAVDVDCCCSCCGLLGEFVLDLVEADALLFRPYTSSCATNLSLCIQCLVDGGRVVVVVAAIDDDIHSLHRGIVK